MRISTRIALPTVTVVAGAALLATVPADASSETSTTSGVQNQAATQAAIASSLKQEQAAITRQQEGVEAMKAAVVANWQAQAAAAEQAAAQEAMAAAVVANWQSQAAAAAAAEQAAAQQAADDEAIAAAVVANWQTQAAAAEQAAGTTASGAGQAVDTYGAASGATADTGTVSYSGGGAVGAAMSMIGQPYVAGGQGPGGFDCSGLVKWAFAQAGVSLPGGSYNQIGYGTAVSADALAPGDLVFYGPGGSQHVAIYIGNGQVVQASNYDTGVHTASLYYIGEPTGFRRI